jgi:hypothetical protein
MRETARHQLRLAVGHARSTDPYAIQITTKGPEGLRLRRIFCAQNRDMNEALQDFWRSQVERYSR